MIKKNKLNQNKRFVKEVIKKYYFEGIINKEHYRENDEEGTIAKILREEGFVSSKAKIRHISLFKIRTHDVDDEYIQLKSSEFFEDSYTYRTDFIEFKIKEGNLAYID